MGTRTRLRSQLTTKFVVLTFCLRGTPPCHVTACPLDAPEGDQHERTGDEREGVRRKMAISSIGLQNIFSYNTPLKPCLELSKPLTSYSQLLHIIPQVSRWCRRVKTKVGKTVVRGKTRAIVALRCGFFATYSQAFMRKSRDERARISEELRTQKSHQTSTLGKTSRRRREEGQVIKVSVPFSLVFFKHF